MKDNKGFSLVELLVAISIAAVVSGSIAYLLLTSLRMYNNETVNAALQQELQVSLNQIVDYTMESQALALKNNGAKTEYLALGSVDSADKTVLNAQVIWMDGNKLYLRKAQISDFANTSPGHTLNDKVKSLVPAAGASDKKYLLAEYVTEFKVTCENLGTDTDLAGNTVKVYDNPLALNITISFSKSGSGKTIDKSVSDRAVFRNRLNNAIYIDNSAYTDRRLIEEASAVTEEVSLDKATAPAGGRIVYTILDIAPGEAYAALPYMAKEGFEYLNPYFQSATGRSCTAWEAFDAYVNRTTGDCGRPTNNTGSDERLEDSNFFSNNDTAKNMYALYTNYNGNNTGYYKYVGRNKGLFAIKSKDSIKYTKYTLATSHPGNKTCYSPYLETEWTKYPYLTKDYVAETVSERIVYRYVGPGQGDLKVEFRPDNSGVYNAGHNDYVVDETGPISNVIMQSIYSKNAKSNDGLDYGWVWVGESHEPTTNFTYGNYKEGDVIALTGYWRSNIVNNELFKLFVFTDECEKYSSTGKIDITHGIWDPDKGTYNAVNKAAVDAFDENILLNFVVKAPKDVTDSDLAAADFIFFETSSDGSSQYTYSGFFGPFTGTNPPAAAYSESNDLTFSRVLKIYDMVVDKQSVAIACPCTGMPELKKTSNNKVPLNMSKLWFMLYGVVDNSVDRSKLKEQFEVEGKTDYRSQDSEYDTAMRYTVVGSGREIFKEFLPGYESEDDGYYYPSGLHTRDFISITQDGSLKINGTSSGSSPQAYHFNEDGYYDGYLNDQWGDGGSIENTYRVLLCLENRYNNNSTNLQLNGYNGSKAVWHHFADSGGTYKILYDPVNSSNHQYLYSLTSGNDDTIGVYGNQMLYSPNSNIFRFGSDGRKGSAASLLWMQKAVKQRKSVRPELTLYISSATDTSGKINKGWTDADPKGKKLECYEFDAIGATTVSYKVTCTHQITNITITDAATGNVLSSFTPGGTTYTGTYNLNTSGGTGVYGIRVSATCDLGTAAADSDDIMIAVRDMFDLD